MLFYNVDYPQNTKFDKYVDMTMIKFWKLSGGVCMSDWHASLIILTHHAKFSDGVCMPWLACEFENLIKTQILQQLKGLYTLDWNDCNKNKSNIFDIDVISTTIFTEIQISILISIWSYREFLRQFQCAKYRRNSINEYSFKNYSLVSY